MHPAVSHIILVQICLTE